MTTNLEALEARVDALAQDMHKALESLDRTADAVQQVNGVLGDVKATLPKDPDKMWKDAFERRDRALSQRNELQQQVEDLSRRLEAAEQQRSVIAKREQARYGLHRELHNRGISKPEAALRLLDIGDEGLDSLCAEDGSLQTDSLDGLVGRIEAEYPEFVTPHGPNAIDTPPAATVNAAHGTEGGSASLQTFNRMYEAARREFDTT